MKNNVMIYTVALVSILLTGCSAEKGTEEAVPMKTETESLSTEESSAQSEEPVLGDLSNLELSGIPEDIPLPEMVYELHSEGPGTFNEEKIYVEFPKIVEAYGGPSASELNPDQDFIFETWIRTNEYNSERYFKPLKEWDGEKIWDIYYRSDELLCDMNASRQIMSFQPDVVERITGESMEEVYWWESRDYETVLESYHLPEDDITGISYQLDGEDVFLEEAVAYVEQTLQDNDSLPGISTPGMEYKVKEINVYPFGENYGLEFNVSIYYKGIRMADEAVVGDSKIDGMRILFKQNVDRVTMLEKDALAGRINFDHLPMDLQERFQKVNPLIGYQKALEIMSGYLSDAHQFEVLNAEPIYCQYVMLPDDAEAIELGDVHIIPCWQFELSTKGMQRYRQLFIDVNMKTGEVIERYL